MNYDFGYFISSIGYALGFVGLFQIIYLIAFKYSKDKKIEDKKVIEQNNTLLLFYIILIVVVLVGRYGFQSCYANYYEC